VKPTSLSRRRLIGRLSRGVVINKLIAGLAKDFGTVLAEVDFNSPDVR
jgi:hypothetical protein